MNPPAVHDAGAAASAALPDLCRPQAVLLLVLLGLLLAMLIALVSTGLTDAFWTAFGQSALMIIAITLTASLVLCTARPVLGRLPAWLAHLLVFVVLQVITALASWLALVWFLQPAIGDAPGLAGAAWLARNVLISMIASLVLLRYLVLYRRWQQQVQAEAQSRLRALQARIRPHFLFNTLNTIASLIRSRPDDAEQAVLDLAELLRTGLRGGGWHRLADEFELIRGYLRIEAQRLGSRLQVVWALDPDLPLAFPVPALLIQPLVENAVVHGIARRADGGVLRIEACIDRGVLRVTVRNPLPFEDEPADGEGHQMALTNVAQRLALAYQGDAVLHAGRRDQDYVAELRLPLSSEFRPAD